MAQHSMTFDDILKKNVRHVYSGLPSDIRFRKHHPGNSRMELSNRILEQQRRPPSRFERKFVDYLSEYDITLPRAPAFRVLHWTEVEDIVDRVTRPTNTHRRPLQTCPREIARDAKDRCPTCELASIKRKVSGRELKVINHSLMRPTKSATMRIMMRRPNADPKYQVRPCTADERLMYPGGRENCCVPCRIIQQTHRPRISSLLCDVQDHSADA